MKVTAQEEYGLRILIRIAGCKDAKGLSIPQLTEAEGISSHYVAKLTRVLRMKGFINSTPGNKGGYVLARPAREIVIRDVLSALGGMIFDQEYTGTQIGSSFRLCTNSVDCSARSLWQMIQFTVDRLLENVTLHDLANPEQESADFLKSLLLEKTMPLAFSK